MQVTIYQLKDSDSPYAFDGWVVKAKNLFSFGDYDKVYEFEYSEEDASDFDALEYCAAQFGLNDEYVDEDFRSRPLSISDVIQVDQNYYYVNTMGYIKINDRIADYFF